MARILGLVVFVLSLLTVTESANNDCDNSPKDQTGMSRTFKSHPTFPNGEYARFSDCQWRIKVPPGYFIHIHFDTSFNIEPAPPSRPHCSVDYITFKQSGTVMKGPFCGSSAPPDFSIYHNDVTVRFKTDEAGQLSGFSLTWTAFSALLDSGCGSPRFQAGLSGTITSMYYPDMYENNARCDWVIRVPVGYRVKLHFDSTFDLENEGGSCKDYVQVYRTDKTATICNPTPSSTTAPNDITSWNNEIIVKFHSNSNARRKGFSITWTAISAVQPSGCGQVDQTGLSGSFNSMNYPSANYDVKAYCFWRITVSDGYRIRLHFNKFHTENHHDIVAIHEESSGPVIYGPYSGTTAPVDILSMDKDLTVVFISDGGTQKEGFQVTWTAIKVPEKFGTNKDLICHCKMGAQCDSTTGVCPNKECAPGWSGDDCQTGNAASGQPAKQSSTYAPSTAAGRAVDGGRDQQMDGYSCTHTTDPPENQPWWRVDLGKRFFLFSLTLYNRRKWHAGCQLSSICQSQLGNLVVWMSDEDTPDPAKGRTCVTYPGLVPFGAKQQLTCSSPVIGRYLFIKSLNSPAALSLCEVVTNAVQYRDCTGQHFGPGCKHRCRCEDRTEQCNSATGACIGKCIYDYDGEDCDKLMPFMKQSLTVTSRTGSSIKVSTPAWSKGTDGGDGTVLKYMLQYRLKNAPTWTNFTEKMTSTGSGYSLDVTGLTAVTAYQFRVVLLNKRTHENDEKLGRPGPVLDANTPCPAVVKPKINDITTGIDSSGTWPERAYLLVKIDNFVTAGMSRSCFRNYYVKTGNQGYEVTSSTTFEYKLHILKAYTTYSVHILLFDIDGKSAKSDDVTKRTAEDTPGEVANLAATQQEKTLRVTWSEPTLNNGIITGYFVERKLTGHGQCENVNGAPYPRTPRKLPSTTRSHDLEEGVMCAYCRYDITVKATTSAGIGKPAGLTNKYTAAAVPTTAPSKPTVESKTSRQVVFKWNVPACKDWNGPDGKYHYLLQQNGKIVKTGPTPAVRVQIDGLSPYTSYSFKIALHNNEGTGPYSPEVTVTTGEEAPGQVASMSVEKFATSIKVKWTPPSSPNGLSTHYRLGLKHLRIGPVSWACTTGISSAWVYKDTTGPVQEYTLSTCPYCMYDVKVQAVNGAGVGAEKTTTGILTKASAPTSAPAAPRVTKVRSRDVSFAWNAMPCQNRNGLSMKYPFRLTTLNGLVKEAGVRDSTTSVTLTGLIPYVTYKFQIAFRNEAGTGPYGVEVSVTTEEEVPPAPGILRVAASLTTVSVKAIKPNPPHGIIIKYTFELWKQGTTGNRNSADILPTDPSHTFSNLKGYTTYRVRAKVWTKKGAGAWSREIDIITVDNVPGAPASVSPLLTSTNSFLLKWTPPKYNNGVLKNYELRCSPLFSYDPAVNKAKDEYLLTFDPSPTERKKNVNGLRPATEYNCSITAQTSKGYGQSTWLKIWTKPNKEKIPEHLFLGISPDQKSDTTITVEVKKLPATLTAGKVSALRIGVEKLEPSRRKKRSTPLTSKEHNQISDYKTAKAAGHTFYIAAELNTSFVGVFVIGDGNVYSGYYNAPLDKGMTYDVIFGLVITAGGVSTTTYSRYGKGIVVGHKATPVVGLAVGITVGCLVLLVAIIVPIVVIKRRKNNASASNEYERPIPMETPQRTNDADENPYDDLKLSDDAKPSVEETEYYVLPGGDGKPTYENVGVREPEGEYQEINISGGVDNPGVVSD